MVKLGAQLYTVRDFIKTKEDFDATLRKVADMGYHYVQISGIGKDVPSEFAGAKLKEYGLTCGATHIGFDELTGDFNALLKKHDDYNCPYIGIGSMPNEFRASAADAQRFIDIAGEIAEKIEKAGKHFIYHNHSFEFVKYDGKSIMDMLFEANTKMQFELDLYWVQNAGGDPIAWIHKVAGRMDVIHYKEMGFNEEGKQYMVPVGQGNMNWKGIVDATNLAGVTYAFVEQDRCLTTPFECLQDSFNYLSTLNMQV